MKTTLAVLAALAVSACASSPTPDVEVARVVSTTSFGMCVGYCTTRLEVAEGQATLIRQARGGRGAPHGLPDQRFSRALGAAEWQDIQRLAVNADLDALPDVVGCPDCADGGAEGLAIETAAGAKTVSFEFGAALAPAQPLLDRMRALREELAADDAD